MEQLSIPAAGGIIVKEMNGEKNILLQVRVKPNENGLLEIPAGKIRAFENIYDTLKREIKEETGLDVVSVFGKDMSTVYEEHSYKVVNFMPFSCAQNLIGDYPIMVFVFICEVKGELLPFSNESKGYQWIPLSELKRIVTDTPQAFYPMHVDTLRKYVCTFEQHRYNPANTAPIK